MKVGIINFTLQLLIISVTATSAIILLFYNAILKKTSNYWIAFTTLLFMLATPQFVLHSHNTYRIFSYLLFTLFFYFIATNKKKLLFVASFLLLQYEYAFAMFTFIMFFLYLLLDGIRKNRSLLLCMTAGAFLSITVFAFQVFTYFTWDELYTEIFEIVIPTRGIGNRSILSVLKTFKEVISKNNMNLWQFYFICFAIASFYILLTLKKIFFINNFVTTKNKSLFASKFLVACFIGGFITTIVLPGYCSDAYGDYNFPFTSFHKIIIFIFISCVISDFAKAFFEKFNLQKVFFILVIFLNTYLISTEFQASMKYFDLSNINRGSYLTAFAKFENYHYISNFWSGRIKNNTVRPLYPEIAYGIEAINKAIIEYKERYQLSKNDSLFYICVKQQPYNCNEMQQLIKNKWGSLVIEENHDYLIIEFTSEILSSINRISLGVTEEHWVELALKFMKCKNFNTIINDIQITPNYNNINIRKIYDYEMHALNILHAFRKSYAMTSNNLNISASNIEYLQMRHPLTWKPALLVGISKRIAENDHKKFPEKKHILQANKYIENILSN